MFQHVFMKDGRNRAVRKWQAVAQIPEQVCPASHQINIDPSVQTSSPTTQMKSNFLSSSDELTGIPHRKWHGAPRRGKLQTGTERVRNNMASQTAHWGRGWH